jgi:uncharacterized membrane protein
MMEFLPTYGVGISKIITNNVNLADRYAPADFFVMSHPLLFRQSSHII